jgi:AcrR family transcriptional regulator
LPPPGRVAANRFVYDERHAEIVRLVRLLRERRHLPIETIRRLLPELLPDLLGQPEGGVFRPEMWQALLTARIGPDAGPSMRDRLVEAGLGAFCHHGFGEVSVDDVCRAVGIAKGSFYRYFDSKEDLFLAVTARVARLVATAVESGCGDEVAAHVVARALAPYLTIVLELASLASQRRPGHARALDELLVAIAEALPDLVEQEGELGPKSVVCEAIAIALAGVLHDRVAIPVLGDLSSAAAI